MTKQTATIFLTTIFALTTPFHSTARADPQSNASLGSIPFSDYQEANKSIGIDVEKTEQGGVTTVTQTLHQEKLTDIIKWLQGSGIMNPEITQTAINLMPDTMSSVVSTDVAVATLMEIYHGDPKVDKVRYIARADIADDFGNDQLHDVFNFNFSRTIFKKINWDKFPTSNLQKVTQNFHYSKWLMENMRSEMSR